MRYIYKTYKSYIFVLKKIFFYHYTWHAELKERKKENKVVCNTLENTHLPFYNHFLGLRGLNPYVLWILVWS